LNFLTLKTFQSNKPLKKARPFSSLVILMRVKKDLKKLRQGCSDKNMMKIYIGFYQRDTFMRLFECLKGRSFMLGTRKSGRDAESAREKKLFLCF
jgi:hypothetical protein